MNKFFIFSFYFFLFCSSSFAQDFSYAKPDYKYQFPRDHGSHPNFKIEWWYYTGHFTNENGNEFGFQWTLFRNSLKPLHTQNSQDSFASKQVYFAHAALSDVSSQKFYYDEKRSRGFAKDTFTDQNDLNHKIQNWSVVRNHNSHIVIAHTKDFSFELKLTPQKKLVLHGNNGVTLKGKDPKNASHYLTYSRMQVSGKLILNGKEQIVNGVAWMDHEFSSSQLDKNAIGWDWFSIQLNQNEEIMLYFLRDKNNQYLPYSSGTYIFADGKKVDISLSDIKIQKKKFITTPLLKTKYPCGWEIQIAKLNLDLNIKCQMNSTELNTKNSTGVIYYEGPILVNGTKSQKSISGKGFVEMTGYAEQSLKNKL